MPREKKPTKKTAASKPKLSQQHLGVLLEDIKSQVHQIQESFTTVATREDFRNLDDKIESVRTEVQIIKQVVSGHSVTLQEHSVMLREHSAKLDELSAKVDQLTVQKADKRDLEKLETRMGNMETRMGNMETRMGNMETKMGNMETKMENLATRDDLREIKTILVNHEQRIASLES